MRFTTKCCYCGKSCLAKYGCCKKCGLKNSPRNTAPLLPEISVIRTRIGEQEKRDILTMYEGAQKALRTLQTQHPDVDYSSALNQCRERISELSG